MNKTFIFTLCGLSFAGYSIFASDPYEYNPQQQPMCRIIQHPQGIQFNQYPIKPLFSEQPKRFMLNPRMPAHMDLNPLLKGITQQKALSALQNEFIKEVQKEDKNMLQTIEKNNQKKLKARIWNGGIKPFMENFGETEVENLPIYLKQTLLDIAKDMAEYGINKIPDENVLKQISQALNQKITSFDEIKDIFSDKQKAKSFFMNLGNEFINIFNNHYQLSDQEAEILGIDLGIIGKLFHFAKENIENGNCTKCKNSLFSCCN
ncbi:MAG: hypothetical protein ACTSXG_00420 [Alphaproteobacteria bacterium]